MWKSRLCTVKTDSCRRNCWKLWKLSFQGNHLFFLLSVPLQRFEVKAAENAAKVPSRKPGFKIKINGVSLWQRQKPAVPEPTHNKIAKWKLILPSWPGVAPDEVGGVNFCDWGGADSKRCYFCAQESFSGWDGQTTTGCPGNDSENMVIFYSDMAI